MNVASPGLAALAATASLTAPSVGDDSALSAERPFPGLRPFAFADRAFYFGRERQIFALYRLVEKGRFIAVIGSSGSGKSSLVLAGLRGLLDEESANPGGSNWVCHDMRPGASPLKRLAGALARLSEKDSADEAARRRDRIEYRLHQSSFSFDSALTEAGGLNGRTLLLIVDQFEELFRFGLAGLGPRRAGIEEARARDEATQFVQILLDVDRRRIENVHVLITMRSDFIGDCAHFHGLSEAVSATQYLVPNLTRGQLEEAIRGPVEKAGAIMEPELVERLVNDCGDELDQLPVLQHCLMRLWDRARAASARDVEATGAFWPRRLTQQTYDEIGRMTEALSLHADEISRQCAGKELAVTQAFRALSEFDREGRAVRRALRFDKLLAETGVDESDLRAVLDRFRAPSCSFLVPPPSATPMLSADDRVDIGHEALLRRWNKISGETATAGSNTDQPPTGWLVEEQIDGQRYRALVSLLDGETGRDRATLTDPERMKHWWDSLPRTAAWADRYGGKFTHVRKLIDDNIAAKGRRKRNRVLVAVVAAACILSVGGFLYKQQIEEARLRQEAIDKSAMNSAKEMLDSVLQAYGNHTLDLDGAKRLATVSEQFLENVRIAKKTSAADLLWVQALEVESDLQSISGDDKKALELATKARDAALPLTNANRSAPEPLQRLYEATLRVGTTLAASPVPRLEEALQEYKEAEDKAQSLVFLSDSVTAESDLIDAHAKIGDIYRKEHKPEALDEYRASLSVCEKALVKFPQKVELLRNEGKAYHRIAQYLSSQHRLGEARDAYQKAMEIQDSLVQQDLGNSGLKSNLAATYTNWGALERDGGDLNLALAKFQKGVALQEELHQSEPTNPQWENYLAPNYMDLAKILEMLKRPKDALVYYQMSFDARRDLAIRAHGSPDLLQKFAEVAKTLGDRSTALTQIDAYRAAVRTWKRLLDDPKSASVAAKHYDEVIGFARAFDAARDWPDAQTAYDAARTIALWNLDKDHSDATWMEKADAAAKGAAAAGSAFAGQSVGASQ